LNNRYAKRGSANFTGTCKICGKTIGWNKQKLHPHKRSGNCTGQTKEDRDLWLALPTATSKRSIASVSVNEDGVADGSVLSSASKRPKNAAILSLTPGLCVRC